MKHPFTFSIPPLYMKYKDIQFINRENFCLEGMSQRVKPRLEVMGNEAIFLAMPSSRCLLTFRSTGRPFLCPHSGPLLNSLAFCSLC